jgi:RimJ/RimL family protein N-acetyltransferase
VGLNLVYRQEDGTEYLEIDRFIALIQPHNTASVKVAGKIGLRREKEIILGGRDVFVYSLNLN